MPAPLEYASPASADERTSKLAVLSLIASLLVCPCLLGWILHFFEDRRWVVVGSLWKPVVAASLLSALLASIAWIRIRFSDQRLRGLVYAALALGISILWLIGIAVLLYLFWNAKFGPAD